jgi:hypothetical protein
MVERRGGPGFLHETANAVRIARQFGRQQLDRDPAMQACVFGQIDLAHAAGAQLGDDAVVGKRPWLRPVRHDWRDYSRGT